MIPLSRPHPQARYLAPEVVQVSTMDCGPASLQSLVQGFGLKVNYGRLREACQTGVDGTSISTMDEIARLLGLDAEEKMLPVDHLLLSDSSALPAIVVVRNPDGNTHFVVAWSQSGPWIQVMDPAQGRHWVLRSAFFDRLYIHTVDAPASAWRDWVAEREFLGPLESRIDELGIDRPARDRLVATALADPGWQAMAALDAAVRMVTSMVKSGSIARGRDCQSLIERQVEPVDGAYPLILGEYRSCWRKPVQDDDAEEEILNVRGAVLVRVLGRRDPNAPPPEADDAEPGEKKTVMPAELAASLSKEEIRPARAILGMLRDDGLLTPSVLAMVLTVSAALVTVNAILLRGLLEVGNQLGLPQQRAAAIGAVILFLGLGLLIELPLTAGALRLGRMLDLRLRVKFLDKIPRLDDRYFRSRLLSDMAERGHSLHQTRALPQIGVRMLSASAQLIFTIGGIAWLAPSAAPLALITVVISIALPMLCLPLMAERELRVRNHAGALGRFYLDALLGLFPIRVHGARPAMQRQQETLLVQWMKASLKYHAASTMIEGVLALCGLGMAALMVWNLASHVTSGLLLLTYWALSLPALGQDIALVARQYPTLRNVVARLLEPLGTPEPEAPAADTAEAPAPRDPRAVHIEMRGLTVEAGGYTVLDHIDLTINPGEHIAVIGPSGAGKSSLVGLMLGWYRPASGSLDVDGRPLVGHALNKLRAETAWVDPAVQLWNRSFLDNLRYGAKEGAEIPLAEILSKAKLRGVLEHLPDGLASELGEGGGMLSGGEGQRTRVGRALARPEARLVILDEPFRGLDLATRRELMMMVRTWWSHSTVLWVTHDIAETSAFDRVLVIDGGKLVEDGNPRALAERKGSRYAQLLQGDLEMHEAEWAGGKWRRIWMRDGQLHEETQEDAS